MNADRGDMYEKKKDHVKIFSPDGLGTEIFRQTGGVIILTILWLLGCLPVVTIGTSTAALYYAMVKAVRKNRGQPFSEFARAYRRNLRMGTAVTCMLLLFAGVIGYEIWLVDTNGLAMGALWAVMSKTLLLLTCYIALFIFPVMSRFDVGLKKIFNLAFVMAIRFWYYGVLLALLLALMVFLQVQLLPIPMVLITPGLTVYIGSFLMERAMKKYMPPSQAQSEEKEEWYS